ncbi:hypothetical protein [Micromonospora aurantiaca (nom. illeg.)]|uniref:hypothetical protein n=1 Tax=Micromonospora aurantiaca (nom. illeg.) TaxID=47850 RepID=UPI00378818CF
MHDSATKRFARADIFLEDEAEPENRGPTFGEAIREALIEEVRAVAAEQMRRGFKWLQPRIEPFLRDRAWPAVKSGASRIVIAGKAGYRVAADELSASLREAPSASRRVAPDASSGEVIAAPQVPRVRMSRAQAEEQVATALAERQASEEARRFSEEARRSSDARLRMLCNVEIVDLEIVGHGEKPALEAGPFLRADSGEAWRDPQRMRRPPLAGDERAT